MEALHKVCNVVQFDKNNKIKVEKSSLNLKVKFPDKVRKHLYIFPPFLWNLALSVLFPIFMKFKVKARFFK